MAPVKVIDYVIVHELCHILHHDHSKLFWAAVEKILPDYEIRQNDLKKRSVYLSIR
jgi:predicted metal-dependent hydrolase